MNIRSILPLAVCVLAGCVSMSEPCAIQQAQFEAIVDMAERHVRAAPPATEGEARVFSDIITIGNQGAELARVNLKLVGAPQQPVPSPTDFREIRRVTEIYEEQVDAFNRRKASFRALVASRFSVGNTLTGGGMLALIGTAVGQWLKKRKAERVFAQTDDACERLPDDMRRTIRLPREAREAHERLDDKRKAQATT